MKKLIAYLILIAFPLELKSNQEPIEILLVGTQHEFTDSLIHRQNLDQIRQRLAEFAPDIICIESIPTLDAASLREVRSSQLETADRLRQEKGISSIGLDSKIDSLMRQLKQDPSNLLVRSVLANHLYANEDFWNAYYHYFILSRKLDEPSQTEDLVALRKSFALDSIHDRITQRQSKGEYSNLVFPLADELGVSKFANIDYRADEDEFLKRVKKAAIGTIFNLKIFKLQKLMKGMQADMQKAEQAGELMAHINSEQQQGIYLDLIDNAHRFKKSKNMRKAVTLWEFRNKVMADRIVRAATRSNAKRVLVTFGAFHVPFVKRYLEANPEIKVITYDQFFSSNIKNLNNQ